jgi:hypothetical protein
LDLAALAELKGARHGFQRGGLVLASPEVV